MNFCTTNDGSPATGCLGKLGIGGLGRGMRGLGDVYWSKGGGGGGWRSLNLSLLLAFRGGRRRDDKLDRFSRCCGARTSARHYEE